MKACTLHLIYYAFLKINSYSMLTALEHCNTDMQHHLDMPQSENLLCVPLCYFNHVECFGVAIGPQDNLQKAAP